MIHEYMAKNEIVRTAVSKKSKHGPKLEDLQKVQVILTKSITKVDKPLFRIEEKSSIHRFKILIMTEVALEQGELLTQKDLSDRLIIVETHRQGNLKGIMFTEILKGKSRKKYNKY